jgi:hypothetical protein
MARCKSCNREIIWITTGQDAKMPVNAKATVAYPAVKVEEHPYKVLGTLVHLPHWGSCPQADEWRRK